MAKDKDKEAGVYKIVDVIGVSIVSWEEANVPSKRPANPFGACGSLKSRKWTYTTSISD
jgi:hypothetical protein